MHNISLKIIFFLERYKCNMFKKLWIVIVYNQILIR